MTPVQKRRTPHPDGCICVNCEKLRSTLWEVFREVERARAKFPGSRFMLAALVEEVGELAQALLQKKSPDEIRKEAMQVACCAVRLMDEGDGTFATLTDAESKGTDLHERPDCVTGEVTP